MKPSDLSNVLRVMITGRRTVMIEGPPGGGKTQVVQQVAKSMGLPILLFHAPTMLPEHVALGMPSVDRLSYNFIANSCWPLEGTDYPDAGVILIDEAPQADNAIQKILANLVQEREIHGHKLKAGWSIVMTGNRASDRAGANRILSHLRNRMTTLTYDVSLDDWVAWAIPAGVRMELIAFLRFKTDLLHSFDPNRDINPTPRAWAEGISPFIGQLPEHLEYELFAGAVGEGPAAEFKAHMRMWRDLPRISDILKAPDTHPVPEKPDIRFAVASSLAMATTEANFADVMTFVNRLPAEFSAVVIGDVVARLPKLQESKTFIKWAITTGKMIAGA